MQQTVNSLDSPLINFQNPCTNPATTTLFLFLYIQIADFAKLKWRDIGKQLGVAYDDLQVYEELHKKPQDKLHAILSEWKSNADHPTVGVLFEACKEAKIGGAQVRKILLGGK